MHGPDFLDDAQLPLSIVTAHPLISSQNCNASPIILSLDSQEMLYTPLPNPVVFVWSIAYLQPIQRSSATLFARDRKNSRSFLSEFELIGDETWRQVRQPACMLMRHKVYAPKTDEHCAIFTVRHLLPHRSTLSPTSLLPCKHMSPPTRTCYPPRVPVPPTRT
jgi:hypothetical protein